MFFSQGSNHNILLQDRIEYSNNNSNTAPVLFCKLFFTGVLQDVKAKRSPFLVPYSLLDERTKRVGRKTVTEALSTLLVYGYILEPLNQELGMFSTIVLIQFHLILPSSVVMPLK